MSPDGKSLEPAYRCHQACFLQLASSMSGTVLIIEDEEAIRETLQLTLELDGFNVVVAANGIEALGHIQGGLSPCLIFLDLMMPEMDGWAFTEELDKRTPARFPIVLVTAFAERAAQLSSRVSGILAKPVRMHALIAAADRHCTRGG